MVAVGVAPETFRQLSEKRPVAFGFPVVDFTASVAPAGNFDE